MYVVPPGLLASAPVSPAGGLHLAVPRRGNVLTTVAERHGGTLRQAARHLATFLGERDALRQQAALLARIDAGQTPCGLQRPLAQTAAWSLVAVWTVAVALRSLSSRASLREAEEWFGTAGTEASVCRLLPDEAQRHACDLVSGGDPEALAQLLPYVLDPHGPGSRLSVMRQPETREARARKRAEGVFYTPADVANYMASLVLPGTSGPKPPRLLDLACGTGVFLRAALERLTPAFPNVSRADLALASLHGVDVDPTALNGAAFVLLHDCGAEKSAAPPVELWRSLRGNLLWADALTLDAGQDAAGYVGQKDDAKPRLSLAAHLPSLTGGADVVLGNPPYADMGPRDDFAVLARLFETVAAAATQKANLYPVFVEQMVRLSAPTAAGSLVLPLSIACNTGPQFAALRRFVARTSGTWRFAFFDRQPHALFGEDVKTRNAIVAWNRGPGDADVRVLTGQLRKWRAQARAAMFSRISFTPLSVPITGGVPKVSGRVQAEALAAMLSRPLRLSGVVRVFSRRSPTDGGGRHTVFVGATAYNFLNVFREGAASVPEGLIPTSHHPHALDCASERDANAVLAVLASGTAFWWWHARDDGFHVSRSTLEELPVGIDVLASPDGDELAQIGADIWARANGAPVVSNNGGKASFAFPSSRYAAARAAVDRLLRRALGLPPAFDAELEHFLHDVTSAGGGARALEQGESHA